MLLIPTRRRTWAPRGHTPIVPYHQQPDRVSPLAALTVSPTRQHLGLYLRFQPRNCQARDVADFLRALLRHLRGHLILLWDRGAIHRGPASEAVQQAYPRLPVEEFPASAPELTPVEQIWHDFNRHMANRLLRDTRHLNRCLQANSRRVRRSQEKVRSFILASKLPSPP